MNFKLVISDPKHKKAYQKEIDQNQAGLIGKKIGDKIPGNILGLTGYELELTGGSDKQGFPMRRDVDGIGRKRVLLSMPPGFHPKIRGQRKRKSVRGNTVSADTSQVNLKVLTYGKEALDKLLGTKTEPKEGEAKKEEAKPEAKAEETKTEAKVEEKKEEKPSEEPKKEDAAEKAEEKMGVKDLEKSEKEAKESEDKEKKDEKKK